LSSEPSSRCSTLSTKWTFSASRTGSGPSEASTMPLDALAVGIQRRKVKWILDADIRGFFDAIDHGWLMKFVEHRIADGRILRLIRKWLSAGVMESGNWTESRQGTPQGASASPLLANVFLHYVFDLWAQQWRTRRARGDVVIVRYADDVLVGFQYRSQAERFLRELRGRLRKFSLELHPDKTRLVEFGAFAASNRQERGVGKPETFDFLGFTHVCAKTRRGKFLLHRRTSRRRMQTKLREMKVELQRRMHLPLVAQGAWLGRVVRGYFAYHAVPTNAQCLGSFRTRLERLWLRTLRRRSQRDRTSWERVRALSRRWIPAVEILHPWPSKRFDVRTRGRSPVR